MTTKKEDREAFEALVEKWRIGKSVRVNGVGPAYREALAKCANELEAALAQQSAVDSRSTHRVWRANDWLPCYCAATSDHRIGNEQPTAVDGAIANLRDAILRNDGLTRKNTLAAFRAVENALATPQQQAVEVTDEMVERAFAAYNTSRGTFYGEVPTDRDDIRAALIAALTGDSDNDQ